MTAYANIWTPSRTDLDLAAASPSSFARLALYGRYSTPPWVKYLRNKLLDVYAGETRRLIVTVPPRSGKSTLISHTFPAWWLGHRPWERVILVSYAADFAATWGEKAKRTFAEWGEPVFGHRLSRSTASRSHWQVEGYPGGGMVTVGVGGPITGRGADLLVIDDPVKNAEEANSEVYREKVWDWFISTAYTRLEPEGRTVVVLTRWHEDDLAGRILGGEELDEPWEVINFPALAEEDDVLGRRPGEALFPERYPVEKLEAIRKQIAEWKGMYWWNALYQQRPSPLGGGLFRSEWFRRFQADDLAGFYILRRPDGSIERYRQDRCQKFATMDIAYTEKKQSDYTVIQVWATTPRNDLLLLHQLRERIDGTKLLPAMHRIQQDWKPGHFYVESAGAQLIILQEARQAGLPVLAAPTEGDKYARAMPLQARMESGTVYFRQGAAYLGDLEDELTTFPNGRHDDQVDAAAYAAIVLSQRSGRVSGIRNVLR